MPYITTLRSGAVELPQAVLFASVPQTASAPPQPRRVSDERHETCLGASMRRVHAPAKSVEVLLLESPEAFANALLARPPMADQNLLIARDRDESLRRFALRALRRLRRMLKSPNQISSVSYLFSGDDKDAGVRTRLLRALAGIAHPGTLRVVGPREARDAMFGYLDAASPRVPGSQIEARFSPTGWAIMSAAVVPAH
jgi:hypothetical protein